MLRIAFIALLLISGLASAKDFTPCYACEKYQNSYSESVKQCRQIKVGLEENECLMAELNNAKELIHPSQIYKFNKRSALCDKQAHTNELKLMSGSAVGIEVQLCKIHAATH